MRSTLGAGVFAAVSFAAWPRREPSPLTGESSLPVTVGRYMRLLNVRIPRTHMLCKRQHVEPDGTYVQHRNTTSKALSPKVAKRMSYLTMLGARAGPSPEPLSPLHP